MSSMRMVGPYRVTLLPMHRHVEMEVSKQGKAKQLARRWWDERADDVRAIRITCLATGLTITANDTAGDGLRWGTP